jgi:single-strand DNA-binding protein
MSNLNIIHLIGRLGGEPDMRYSESGQCRTRFRLATNRPARAGTEPATDWHQVVCWGQVAEFAGEYATTGRLVYVSGRIAYSSYDGRDGQTYHRTEIVAREVLLLDRRPAAAGEGVDGGVDGGVDLEPAEEPDPPEHPTRRRPARPTS